MHAEHYRIWRDKSNTFITQATMQHFNQSLGRYKYTFVIWTKKRELFICAIIRPLYGSETRHFIVLAVT